MSNQNLTFAYCRDSSTGAQFVNGSWEDASLNLGMTYVGAFGVDGKFMYLTHDDAYAKSIDTFVITDSLQWHRSSIPSIQYDCIVATERNSTVMSYSFDGITFSLGDAINDVQL